MKSVEYMTLFFLFPLLEVWDNAEAFGVVPRFDSGISYEYQYSMTMAVETTTDALERGVGITMEAIVQIHSLWRNPGNPKEQLMHFRFQDLQLIPNPSNKDTKHSTADELTGGLDHNDFKTPFLVHILSGKIKDIFDTVEDHKVVLNLKKGLASLFQIQSPSGILVEDDVTGRCQVSYQTSGNQIIKTKDYQHCEKMMTDNLLPNQVVGLNMNSTTKSVYTLEDDQIKSIKSDESHVMFLDVQSTVGIKIISRQLLQLISSNSASNELAEGQLQEALDSFKGNYMNRGIHAAPTGAKPGVNAHSIPSHVDALKVKGLDKSKASTTKAFLKLIESLRIMKRDEIALMLKKSDRKVIPILIDAAAAASTPASLDALASYLDATDPKQSSLLERFLYACAFSAQPSTNLINIISNITSRTTAQKEIHETALMVLGTVIRKMCSVNKCKLQEVEDAKHIILEGLHASKEETEMKPYLLALKSALLPEAVPVLLQYIDRSKAISSIVLSTLQSIPSQHITEEVKVYLRHIFSQRKRPFAATLRLAAAEILLKSDPLHTDVRDIILTIGEEDPEISKFLTSKIMSMLRANHSARSVILDVLKDPKLNNYFHLGRVGSSSSYAGFMTETKDMATSYDFDFLFSEAGVLKQSNSNFYTHTRGKEQHSLQVSLEVSGLDSFFGVEPAEGEEEEELMAGMSAMLLGVQIRPTVFFQGYADLVDKYFSAGEGPVNILSGNVLIIDHLQSLILQSGLQTHVLFHGGLSVDVSGDLEFGLFTQESKSTVSSRFALVLIAKAEVDASVTTVGAETEVEMSSKFVFVNTVSFSDMPVQYCLQLMREPILFRKSVSTHLTAQDRKEIAWQRRQKWISPGEESALHRDNSKMCKKLLNVK